MTRGNSARLAAGSVVLVLVLAACGSSGGSSSKSTTTTKAAAKKATATATPTTGLADGTVVTVTAKNFTPGVQIGVNECADTKNTTAGQDDCDLGGIAVLVVDKSGGGTTTIAVKSSGIGKAQHTCGGDTRCFLSVGELTQGGGERADDIDLTFG
jgi:hypothetical protein